MCRCTALIGPPLCFGWILLWFSMPALLRLRELDANAEHTEGRVVEVGRGRRSSRLVTFTFRPGGGPEVTASRFSSAPQARQLQPGQVISVVYLPDDPQRSSWPLDDRDERRKHWNSASALWVFFGMWLFMIALMELMIAWDRYLARHGVLGLARVTESGTRRGRRGRVRHWVRYEPQFGRLPPRSCFAIVPRSVLDAHPPGSLIPLLYLPCCPRHHELLARFWAVQFLPRLGSPPTG
jgi:hypothetical protein